MAVEERELPVGLPPPPDRGARRDVALLRSLVQERAQTLGMAPEMLARRRDLEELVRIHPTDRTEAATKSPLLSGWRSEAVGTMLLQRLEEIHR